MKKIITCLLIMMTVLSLTACGKPQQKTPEQKPEQTEEPQANKTPVVDERKFDFGDFTITADGFEFSGQEDMSSGEYINLSYDYKKDDNVLSIVYGDASLNDTDFSYLLNNLGAKKVVYNDIEGYESITSEMCIFAFELNKHTWMIATNSEEEFKNILKTLKI